MISTKSNAKNRLAHLPTRGVRLARRLTSRGRALPDFLIIGAQKGGTTFLYHLLQQHPDVLSASVKEVHYFDEPVNFRRGISWYRSHFSLGLQARALQTFRKRKVVTGEASPFYVMNPLVAQRVAQAMPSVKVILLLRNPIDRAFSHYQMQVRKKIETLSFEESLAAENERLQNDADFLADKPSHPRTFRQFSYRTRGVYLDQILEWEKYFPRSQMLILQSEELFAHTAQESQKVLDFLGISPYQFAKAAKAKKNDGQYTKMNPETHEELRRYFEPHNKNLYEHLGVDFGWDKVETH